MTQVIRWFSAFAKGGKKSAFSQLRWEMAELSGERAAEWCSGAAALSEEWRINVVPQMTGDWLVANPLSFERGTIQAGTSLTNLRLNGTQIENFLTVVYGGQEKKMPLCQATSSDVVSYADGVRYHATLYDNAVGHYRIASPVGFLYEANQVTQRFLSDCWSKRDLFGGLYPTHKNTEASESWHSECFVTGAPVGVVLTEHGCRIAGDPAQIKQIIAKARALAMMRKIPIYAFALNRRDPAGLRRIN